jgi:hypothetical protein
MGVRAAKETRLSLPAAARALIAIGGGEIPTEPCHAKTERKAPPPHGGSVNRLAAIGNISI